jgi:hypothetical protein
LGHRAAVIQKTPAAATGVFAKLSLDAAAAPAAAPSRMPRSLLSTLLLVAAVRASADVASMNPDRWDTVELIEGGAASLKADQILFTTGKPDADFVRQTRNANAGLDAILPLTERLTLTLGAGGDWTETNTASSGANGANVSENSLAVYSAAGRWYFESPSSKAWAGSENPDRWTSLGLAFGGTQTVNYNAGNSTGNNASQVATNAQTLTLDARVPVDDAWTALVSVNGGRTGSVSQSSATAPTIDALILGAGASLGVRYYMVGSNLILDDRHLNPDKWTMFTLSAAGGSTLYSRMSLPGGTRADESRNLSATAGARLPITDHVSLSFISTLGYSRTFVPAFGSFNGDLTRAMTLSFSAYVRYFFF